VNENTALLSNTVNAVAGLCLKSRVPVRIKKKQVVGARQVKTNAASPQRE
jgi:hypothetical protein